MAYDALLDPVTGDFPDSVALADGARNADIVFQWIRKRVNTWLGEDLLDTSAGVAWGDIFQARPLDVDAVRDVLFERVLGTPGVRSLEAFDLTLETGSETLVATGSGTLDAGIDSEGFTFEMSASAFEQTHPLIIIFKRGAAR